MSAFSFAEPLTRTLTPEPFRQLARQTRWLQRQGKIDAFEFFTGLAFGQLSAGRQTLSAHAQGLGEPALRLVALRLSPESAARHRQGLREASRRQGCTPTAAALELAGWLLLLPNAPARLLPTARLSYVYRLRGQIELIFRQLKTSLRLAQTESENPCRVPCELWARLSAAVRWFHWQAQTNAEGWHRYQCPASFEKVLRSLQQWGRRSGRRCGPRR